jgi:prepilin-type processing-associated H-X9-DG protein
MDRTDDERLAESDANGPYLYSYSLTGYGVSLTEFWGLDGNQNFGLASVFTGDINNPTVSIFKQASLMNPSRKIMLAEEPGTKNPNDNPQQNWIVIQDGRWMPDRDWLTIRHGGKANVAFADAHQEMVTWQFGTNFVNSRADF